MAEFKKLVGEQIRKTRKARGLTQERLAERAGLSFSYLSDVERGTRNISLDSLGKIMQALSIQPVELFADAEVLENTVDTDGSEILLESIQGLLTGRGLNEIEFILKMTQEFLFTVDGNK